MHNRVRGESMTANGEAELISLQQPLPVDSGVPSDAAAQTGKDVDKSIPRWTVMFNTLCDVGRMEWRRFRPSRRTLHRLDWIAWFACVAAILWLLIYLWSY